MVGGLIMIGLCYLGLLACGIALLIDILGVKIYQKIQKFWKNFHKNH